MTKDRIKKIIKSGKRKTAIARAVLVEGSGKISINKKDYKSLQIFNRLKIEEPEEFARAVKFEKDLQAVKRVTDNMQGVPYLHGSCTPLDSVDFTTDVERGQGELWGNECEGLCGV